MLVFRLRLRAGSFDQFHLFLSSTDDGSRKTGVEPALLQHGKGGPRLGMEHYVYREWEERRREVQRETDVRVWGLISGAGKEGGFWVYRVS